MTQNTGLAARERRRHPPCLDGQKGVTYGIDAAMDTMQRRSFESRAYRTPANAGSQQLPSTHHPVLRRRQLAEQPIDITARGRRANCAFCP